MSTNIWKGYIVGETKLRNAPLCARRALVATLACAAMLLAVRCTWIGASDEGDMSATPTSPAIPAEVSPTPAETPTLMAEPADVASTTIYTRAVAGVSAGCLSQSPGRSLSVTQHLEESKSYLFTNDAVTTQVCLSVRFQPLMDRGDSFDNVSQWLPRLQLNIDGNRKADQSSLYDRHLLLSSRRVIRRQGNFCIRFRRVGRHCSAMTMTSLSGHMSLSQPSRAGQARWSATAGGSF